MRAPRQESITIAKPADAVFQAALGVAQNTKGARILAVHNGGRKLVVREKAMMSNPKFVQMLVEGDDSAAQLHVVVGTDPRSQKALMDGKANEKSLKKFVTGVQGALDGSAPVTTASVTDHYLVKKDQVPWTDADQDPQIELDGNLLAWYGL